MKRQEWFIFTLIAVSLVAGLLEGLFYWFNVRSEPIAATFANIWYIILLTLWIDADSKEHPEIQRPFDYGFLVFIFWLPYLPYYLWRTRGILGLLMFVGFFILLFLGWLIQVGIYMWRIF